MRKEERKSSIMHNDQKRRLKEEEFAECNEYIIIQILRLILEVSTIK